MAHGENSSMNTVKLSCLDSTRQALAAYARPLELLARDHAVLASREPCDERIRMGVGVFLTHARE